jgi:aminoglycoside phosphotransferase (APT) family kinase protein
VSVGQREAIYPRHNWLPAVIPADARRFRVADERLAATLAQAGAELVAAEPDIEIAPARKLEGRAPYAIVSLNQLPREGGPRLLRAVRRSLGSFRVQALARALRLVVRRRGYPITSIVVWEWEQVVRLSGENQGRRHLRVAERLPLSALVVGSRRGKPPTVLDNVLREVSGNLGSPIRPGWPLVRQGGLVVIADQAVVRVAIGPAGRELRLLRTALEALRRTGPPSVVSDRVPWILDAGRTGLAEWTVERRLPGSEPPERLTDHLLADCVDFLVALHGAGAGQASTPLAEHAAVIAAVCDPRDSDAVARAGRDLDESLDDVSRGFAHGDFWMQNLLTEGGRLVGVVDWHGAGPGRLPLLDLLHLRLSEIFQRTRRYLGTTLVEHLLPWARSGGDDVARSYCQRIGIEPSSDLLESLVIAYWLTRTARELEMYADRVERPVWMRHNVTLVARTIADRPPVSRRP